jgi:DNA-binding HxlR family transcriptional regulator
VALPVTGIRDRYWQDAVKDVGAPPCAPDFEFEFRAGGYALSPFFTALHGLVLRALADGPLRLADLRREVGGPAQTTLRGNLRNLISMGALEKRRSNDRGSLVDHVLTPAGAELLFVAETVEAWLQRAPERAIRLESETGKAAIKALVGGWDSTMLRALAVHPFSLTELDNLITAFSYPALERRLGAMRLSSCVKAVPGSGGGTPYAVTDWLRRGMAPLLAAVRCERRHMAQATAPLTRIDIETILLLSVPLVSPAPGLDGVSQLVVEAGECSPSRSAGVRLAVRGGRLDGCTSRLEPGAANWIRGSVADWLDALVLGRAAQLEVSGDRSLTLDLVDALHRALFIS